MNSFQLFVNRRLRELHLSRPRLVVGLGYRNITKGLRRLDALLAEGRPCPQIEENLHLALDASRDRILSLLEEVRKARQIRVDTAAEAASLPFLHVVTERSVPSQITLCGLLGMDRKKRVPLPKDFWELPNSAQLKIVSILIRKHMQECNGQIPFFGQIRYYTLSRKPMETTDELLVFNPTGERVYGQNITRKDLIIGSIVLSHNNRQINPGIFRSTEPDFTWAG